MVYFINQHQTKEERNYKYKVLRYFGLSRNGANRLRDWSINHIVLFLRSNTELGKSFFSKDKIGDWDFNQLKSALNPLIE